jgi:DNA mismatch repair protein MutS2
MDIVEKSLEVLEWPKLKDKLIELTFSPFGTEAVLNLSLETDEVLINQRLQETAELKHLLQEEGDLPLDGIYDLRPLLLRLDKEGVLTSQELMQIYRTLVACARIKTFFSIRRTNYPHLSHLVLPLMDLKDLRRHLGSCLDEGGQLADSASPLLRQLRRQVISLQQVIKDRLDSIINSPQYAHILQEDYFTIRGGRYVIPIKAEARGRLPGIVHDSSISGVTLFVEPQELVDLNNRLRIAELELEHESYRILRDLSQLVVDYIPEIKKNLEILGHLDLTYSKARLAIILSAHPPRINNQGKIKLLQVRHPLLILNQEMVVPNDISLGDSHRGMIITGPNAGGKTIMLKTIGLCTVMSQAGLLIPASADSEISIFPKIYADIGDPQSVEGNLSTFSGHLSNIIEIIQAVTPGSLVLLDEIVTSTDPQEGEALAQAIIETFIDLGAYLVVTTHYNHLKTLASQNSMLVNAAMEYDFKLLRPSFRLILGIPGRSYGMEIAQRLGLSPKICMRAKELLGHHTQAIDQLLSQLEEQRQVMETKARELSEEKDEVSRIRIELQEELDKIKRKKEKIILDFQQELSHELNQARIKINTLLEDIKQERRREKIKSAQKELYKLDQEIKDRQHIKGVWTGSGAISSLNNYHKGDEIEIISLRQRGILLEEPAGKEKVEIQVGLMRLQVNTTDLLPIKRDNKKKTTQLPTSKSEILSSELDWSLPTADNCCDLRGLTVEEARAKTESFLDKAMLKNLNSVYLIHGHGTGALKKALRNYLASSPYVRSFHPGHPHEGGDGITVVVLK